jgi:hypothetical protein
MNSAEHCNMASDNTAFVMPIKFAGLEKLSLSTTRILSGRGGGRKFVVKLTFKPFKIISIDHIEYLG